MDLHGSPCIFSMTHLCMSYYLTARIIASAWTKARKSKVAGRGSEVSPVFSGHSLISACRISE